ncbi:MAG: hypothetical protein HXY38_12015 [Chloroflexi bacterium]|nr:hypothetical protein [Chloroflexota bacterium]
MKMKTKLTLILLLAALLVLPFGAVHAQTKDDESIFLFGQNYTLREGETLNGSIAVFGGNVQIEKDAEVNGSIAVFGGNVNIADGVSVDGSVAAFGSNMSISGIINGDIVIVGGNVLLTEASTVDGDIATFGGQVTQEPGAEVTGEITNNTPPEIGSPETPETTDMPNVPVLPEVKVSFNPFLDVLSAVGWAVLIAIVGMLLSLFLQPQLDRTASAITRQPVIAGAYGVLIFLALPVGLIIMIVTLILIPVAAIAAIMVPLAWLFGVIAMGQEVGERFAKAINQVWTPILATGFGTFLLVLVTRLLNTIPCVGWLLSTIVALVGIGAVAMTWFGTRNPPGYITPVIADEVPPAS